MNKKIKNISLYFVILMLAVMVGFGAVKAYNGLSPKVVVEGDYLEAQQPAPADEISLGGAVHNALESFDGGIAANGKTVINSDGSEITFWDNGVGVTEFYAVVNFEDATITPATFRLAESNWYLQDAWLENTGKATTTVRIGLTTSTETFLSGDNTAYLNADAGTMTLMRTLGNAFGADGASIIGATATSSKFFLSWYPGTETSLALATQKMPIYIASSTNLVVFATSTASDGLGNYGIVGTNNTFDGKLHVRGMRFR